MLKTTALAALLCLFGAAAQAQSTVLDQIPAPAPSNAPAAAINSELITQSYSVPGGTLYLHTLRQSPYNGGNGQPVSVSTNFVASPASVVAANISAIQSLPPSNLGRTPLNAAVSASSFGRVGSPW